MDIQHTPGPWYVGAQNDYFYVIDRPPSPSNDYPNHEADTELVAKPFAARGASVEANARLIAAAPELLAACIEFVRKCDAGEAKSTRSYAQMVSAIAKANGRSF